MARRNRVSIRVDGVRLLTSAIERYGQEVVYDATAGVEHIGRTAVVAMVKAAPFDPKPDNAAFHLREQVEYRIVRHTYGVRLRLLAWGRHAHLQEFGTARHAANPYFVPQVRAAREQLEQLIAAVIRRRAPRDLGTPTVRTRTGTSTTPPLGVG